MPKWLVILPLFIVNTIVCSTLTVVLALISPNAAFYAGVAWAKINQFLCPMLLTVEGRENIKKGQSYVIMANHQSPYDIIAIYGNIGIPFRWIMKIELRKAPLIGWACAKARHIFIDRSSKMAAYRSIQKAKEILTEGTSVMIFPEGTRSYNNELTRFKSGGFKLAFQLGLPILPVSIRDTHKVMGRSIFTMRPARAKLIIHEPIDASQYINRQDELMERVKESMLKGLE